MEQCGTGTWRLQDGTSQTLQDMNLCADLEINLEVGWPPAQDQVVAGSHIAICNTEEKIQTNHKEELLSALKTLLEDIDDGIKQRFRKTEDVMIKHNVYTRNQVALNLYWHLGHHHTELLGNIREFMTPVMTTVDNLETKMSALT